MFNRREKYTQIHYSIISMLSILELKLLVLMRKMHDCFYHMYICLFPSTFMLAIKPCQPKTCIERECFSYIHNLRPNLCHLCPPYLPTTWYFLPFQVNTSCATFKLFKLLLLICVNVLQLMRKYVVFYLSILLGGLSPMDQRHIRLSNNFAIRAGNGVPSPN